MNMKSTCTNPKGKLMFVCPPLFWLKVFLQSCISTGKEQLYFLGNARFDSPERRLNYYTVLLVYNLTNILFTNNILKGQACLASRYIYGLSTTYSLWELFKRPVPFICTSLINYTKPVP